MCRYTFLLPAYKAKFFEEALLSIKNQTFVDFKVLASDDCSPEPLRPIFDRVCGSDPRFQYRRNETNMGSQSLVSHWNLLVGLCDTEYLVMASDDDRYHPRFLEEMDCLSKAYPQVDLLRARVRQIDSDGELVFEEGLYKEYVSPAEYLAQTYTNTAIHCLSNFVFRASRLKKDNLFPDFPNAWFSDDAGAILSSVNGCANSKDVLFFFRLSGISVSTAAFSQERSFRLVDAALQYDVWFNHFLKSFSWNSQYEIVLKNFVRVQHCQYISSFFCRSIECSWSSFWNLCHRAKCQGIPTIGCKVGFFKRLLSFR